MKQLKSLQQNCGKTYEAGCKKCGKYFKLPIEKQNRICQECWKIKEQTRSKQSKKVLKYYYQNIEEKRKYQRERYYLKKEELLQYQHQWNGQTLRDQILKRDNYTCQICLKKDGGTLVLHHINGNGLYKKGVRQNSKDIENQFDNLVSLHYGCHTKLHAISRNLGRLLNIDEVRRIITDFATK